MEKAVFNASFSVASVARCIRFLQPLVLGGALAGLAACATVRGAPRAPFDESTFAGSASPLSLTATDLSNLINAADEPTRNRLLRRLLSDMDVRYLAFSDGVTSGKSRFEFGKNLLTLSASVASSLTPSAGVKANYAALTTLLNGGGAQVDSNFLFSQTSLALVSTMDERRAVILGEIRTSMRQPIEDYPGQTAFGDAIRYFRAGTLASAAQELQKAAAGRAAAEETILRSISIPTDAQVARSVKRGQTFVAFVDDKKNIAAVRAALIVIKVDGIDANTADEDVRTAAKDYYRRNGPSGEAEDLIVELKKKGYVPN